MRPINQLLKNQTTLLASAGKQCDLHGGKKVEVIIVDGEEVCPICERDRENDLLSQRESEKIRRAMTRKNYKALEDKSILTNTDLFQASFSNYETAEVEEIDNKDRGVKIYQKYNQGEIFNTWFTGLPGVGKSHLAMSILRNLNEAGEQDRSCIFVSVDEMLLRIRNSFDNKESKYTEYYFVELLSKADFVVLDDLGAETGGTGTTKRATDFTLRVLYAIANARQDKCTLVTTNLTKPELVQMYDAKLVSRLQATMALIDFQDTSDKRIRQIEI